MGATAGIIGVNIVYFVLSLIGIGAALAASPQIFLALKYAGAAYLGWTALQILWELAQDTGPITVPAGGPATGRSDFAWRHALPSGILVQASSVKNLIIFLSIVPQFVDHTRDVGIQFIGLCGVSVLVELPVLAGYAWLAGSVSRSVRNASIRVYLDLASAIMLLGIAGVVLVSLQT